MAHIFSCVLKAASSPSIALRTGKAKAAGRKSFSSFSARCSLFFLIFCFLSSGCSPSLEEVATLYKKITQQYEKIIANDPADRKARLKLAQFYYRFNNYEKVKSLLEGRKEKEAKLLLAKALVRLKEYTLALDIFRQLGEIDDNQARYSYAQALEGKNLFPQAVEVYKNLTPPFKARGAERIKQIGVRIEEGCPSQIKQLLRDEDSFISQIDEEAKVILLVEEAVEIKEDNTSVFSMHVIEKVLKEKGKDIGEVTIGYDSTDERVELEYARTITPQGKVVYAGQKNIRDVSKYLNFPLYSNARVFIISMPSVEVGSVVEYKAKVFSSKLINKDDFTFLYRLKGSSPIGRETFKVIVPKHRDVKLKFLNEAYSGKFNLAPTIKENDGKKIYSWTFTHVPPIIPEDEMPPVSLINPAIIISSFSSWEEIYQWWFNLFKDKLSLGREIKEFVKELIRDCTTDLEKANKIYRFCAKDVRYVGVEYGKSGHEPHSAQEVFLNRYGDCKDKAILLVAMFREVGLAAYPVLIPTREVYAIDRDFPSLNFNHAIAAFHYKGKIIFLDPTATTASFYDLPLNDQERNVLVFFDDGYKIVTTPRREENEVLYETQINIDAGEDARIERKVTTQGSFATFQRFYFYYSHPQQVKANIQSRIVQLSPFAQLVDYTIENKDDFKKPPILRYTFTTEKILNPAQRLRIFPNLGDIQIDPAYVGKEARQFPIDFGGVFRKISRVKVVLPANLDVKYLPQQQSIDTKWFVFDVVYKHEAETLNIYQRFANKQRFVNQQEYREFKENLERVFYLLREKIILTRISANEEEANPRE